MKNVFLHHFLESGKILPFLLIPLLALLLHACWSCYMDLFESLFKSQQELGYDFNWKALR